MRQQVALNQGQDFERQMRPCQSSGAGVGQSRGGLGAHDVDSVGFPALDSGGSERQSLVSNAELEGRQ